MFKRMRRNWIKLEGKLWKLLIHNKIRTSNDKLK